MNNMRILCPYIQKEQQRLIIDSQQLVVMDRAAYQQEIMSQLETSPRIIIFKIQGEKTRHLTSEVWPLIWANTLASCTIPTLTITSAGYISNERFYLSTCSDLLLSSLASVFTITDPQADYVDDFIAKLKLHNTAMTREQLSKSNSSRYLMMQGHINAIFSDSHYEQILDEWIQTISRCSPASQQAIKQTVQYSQQESLISQCIAYSQTVYKQLQKTHDYQIGAQCFINKKMPEWSLRR